MTAKNIVFFSHSFIISKRSSYDVDMILLKTIGKLIYWNNNTRQRCPLSRLSLNHSVNNFKLSLKSLVLFNLELKFQKKILAHNLLHLYPSYFLARIYHESHCESLQLKILVVFFNSLLAKANFRATTKLIKASFLSFSFSL